MKVSGINQVNAAKSNFKGHLYVDQDCEFKNSAGISKFAKEVKEKTSDSLDVFITDMPIGSGGKTRVFKKELLTGDDELEHPEFYQDSYMRIAGEPQEKTTMARENLKIRFVDRNTGVDATSGFYFTSADSSDNMVKYLWQTLETFVRGSIKR